MQSTTYAVTPQDSTRYDEQVTDNEMNSRHGVVRAQAEAIAWRSMQAGTTDQAGICRQDHDKQRN